MAKDYGKEFESRIQENAKSAGVYTFRVRDVHIPFDLRGRVRVPKNKYDFIFYYKGKLFPSELKSTKEKSFSFEGTNPKIKPHQIKGLIEDEQYEGIVPTLLLNFREPENRAFLIHINDFNNYVKAANGEIEKTLEGRHNEKSIPLHIAEQIGVEVKNVKKLTRYTYFVKQALDELIKKYE